MAIDMRVYFDFGGADGAPGTNLDITNLGPPRLKFKLADNGTIDEANPVKIPGPGQGPYHSALKHLYLKCIDPDGKTISNIRLFSDGVNNLGTGCDFLVGLQFPTKNSGSDAGYEVATADPTTTPLEDEHSLITTSDSLFNYTTASPLTITISEAGNEINAAGETSNYFVMQGRVQNTAIEQTTIAEPIYLAYDSA